MSLLGFGEYFKEKSEMDNYMATGVVVGFSWCDMSYCLNS